MLDQRTLSEALTTTLSEALAILRIVHVPSKIEGKRDWFTPEGELIGSFDAHEGWAKIKEVAAQIIRTA